MMRNAWVGLAVAVFCGWLAADGAAQTADFPRIGSSQPPTSKPSQPPAATKGPPPSAESMGVSLKAIRSQLKDVSVPREPTSSGSGMRYDFFVDVLGKRPPIDFFRDFDLSTKGGVRWGAPTHSEILNAVTPYWVTQVMPTGSGVNILSIGRKK
jgi:hypothetical protein